MTVTNATLATLMALAAWFLGLSLFVQIVQELYKLLTSSKSRAYSMVLVDFAGTFAKQLLDPDIAPELTVRGPFQFRRRKPQGRFLPLEKDTLITALERTAPTWHRLTREALQLESQLQGRGFRFASTSFRTFLAALSRGTREEPGKFDAIEMSRFLQDRGIEVPDPELAVSDQKSSDKQPFGKEYNAQQILAEFRIKYSPQIVRVERNFDQLMRNYKYAYRRRNLRQTFVLTLLLALWFDFAFDSLYARAAKASGPEVRSTTENIGISYLPQPRGRAVFRENNGTAASPNQPRPRILRATNGRNSLLLLWLCIDSRLGLFWSTFLERPGKIVASDRQRKWTNKRIRGAR